MASVKVNKSLPPPDLEPTDVYGSSGPIALRIATGGAGQSGLLKALALAFIDEYVTLCFFSVLVLLQAYLSPQDYLCRSLTPFLPWVFEHSNCLFPHPDFRPNTASQCSQASREPFRVAWIASDTSLTFNSLAQGSSDVGITYHAYAERVALQQGVVNRIEYAWRDHFVLVGPQENPAGLPTDGKASIYELFALLFQAAINTASSSAPVRFLSRYDKSANNIAESRIWTTIGQTPWSTPYSPFYHQYLDFPFGALRAASKLGEYTLVDRGTWNSIEKDVRDRMILFKESFEADENDPLLNPAHIIVGKYATNNETANSFVDWMIGDRGQKIVSAFEVNGVILYSGAPVGVDPMNRVELLL
jgi:ABC-type tungstate transport system permease subunit